MGCIDSGQHSYCKTADGKEVQGMQGNKNRTGLEDRERTWSMR
jgi:hypothetical protein